MSQVVSANIKKYFTNIDKFSTKFVKFYLFNDFLRARAVVGPTEVRFAHPVRLVPDTRSQ